MLCEIQYARVRPGFAERWVQRAIEDAEHLGVSWHTLGTIGADQAPARDFVQRLEEQATRLTTQPARSARPVCARITLWLDFRVSAALRLIDPAPALQRLSQALERTLVDGQGLYYSTAAWGMRRFHALLGPELTTRQRLRVLGPSFQAEIEARWLRASHRSVGLSTPSYVDTERGRVTLSRLLRSTPQREERIAYLAVRSEGRDVGTVAVRPGHGPLWARIPQGHLELPSFHQVHPQFRTEARWQHTEAFLAALADVSLRPVGHPAVGKRRAGPDHQRPHLTNETIALSVDLPAPAAACVTRQHIERAFLEAWPQAEHSSLCAIRYHLDQRNLTVQLALASVLPGHNPFLGQARKDRFRQNLLGLLQPLAATATLSPGTRELPAERTLARA